MAKPVEEGAPSRVPAWRLLAIAALIAGLYVVLTSVSDDAETRPWLLAAAVVGGAALGAAVGRFEPAAPTRGRRKPSGHSAARTMLVGSAGVALILVQLLSSDAMSWLLLCGAGFVVSGAAYEWARARRTPS